MSGLLSTFSISDKVNLKLSLNLDSQDFDLDISICLGANCLSEHDLGLELLEYVGDIVSVLSSSPETQFQRLAKKFSNDIDMSEHPAVEVFSHLFRLVSSVNHILLK